MIRCWLLWAWYRILWALHLKRRPTPEETRAAVLELIEEVQKILHEEAYRSPSSTSLLEWLKTKSREGRPNA